jgi:hypothetical protein
MSKTSKSKKVELPKMDDIWAKIKADQLKKAEQVKHNAKLLFDTLQETRVVSIEVTFDGCGDSGQIESVVYEDHRGKEVSEPKLLVKGSFTGKHHEWDDEKKTFVEVGGGEGKVRDIVEQVCYDKLEASHGGWELNEGSYGTFNFDVLNRKVELAYNERIEEVRSSSESF